MDIVIPTYGRGTDLATLKHLPADLHMFVTVVVQKREYPLWADSRMRVTPLPQDIQTVGPTRQWILENFGPKVIIMDDDLRFATRMPDNPKRFTQATAVETVNMVESIWAELDEYAVVGVCPREGGNNKKPDFDINTRIIRVTGLRTDIVKECGVRYDRLPVMEDFDITLQMIRHGYPNKCLHYWVHNQGLSQSVGGCSGYRTPELQRKAALMLAQHHQPFVKVVTKQTKVAWGGEERTDVVIYWKKAFAKGRYPNSVPRDLRERAVGQG